MRRPQLSLCLAMAGLLVFSWTIPCSADDETMATPFGLHNGRQINENILVGGQPTPEQLDALAQAGFRSVVNLRGEGEEGSWDEGPQLAKLGLFYMHLPVTGGDDLNPGMALQLADWLEDPEHLPALVHCASSNRVGALFALKAFHFEGQDAATALEIGRQHGLKSLEPKVEALLVEPPSEH